MSETESHAGKIRKVEFPDNVKTFSEIVEF